MKESSETKPPLAEVVEQPAEGEAAIAQPVEPAAGEVDPCLNCGAMRVGEYCHRCGQEGDIHQSLKAFWHDLAHSVLHFEGKIWRTLPLLALYPGDLTRRYIAGERARFVSPMALFLFSVFAMFATFSAIGGPLDLGLDPAGFANPQPQLAKSIEDQRSHLLTLTKERLEQERSGNVRSAERLQRQIEETEEGIRRFEQAARLVAARGEPQASVKSGWKRLDDGFKKFADNPGLGFYKVQNNAYKFSWLLIPLSVPFIWLLFPLRKDTNLYAHTVFVTYSISFMTLLMVSLAIARLLGASGTAVVLVLALLPPVHIYRQLKGAYGLSWWRAAFGTLVLLVFAVIVLSLFIGILIFLGAIG